MFDLQDLDPIPVSGKGCERQEADSHSDILIRFQEGLERGGKNSAAVSFGTKKKEKLIIRISRLIQFKKSGTFCSCLFRTEAKYTQESKNGKILTTKQKRQKLIRFQKGRPGTGG